MRAGAHPPRSRRGTGSYSAGSRWCVSILVLRGVRRSSSSMRSPLSSQKSAFWRNALTLREGWSAGLPGIETKKEHYL
jgi:hypothetical protein